MGNEKRRPTAPTHLGVRVLWAIIIGYGVVALPSALLVSGRGAHLVGVVGAVAALVFTLRSNSSGRGRGRPTAERPHDGWIG